MVKLRLKRMGSINKPFYRIVSLDSRKKRDGAYLESIGYYDPKTDPFTLKVDTDRAIHWLNLGAQPSDTVRSLLKKAGVMQKWHEMKLPAEAEESDVKEKKEAKKKTSKVAKPKKEEKVAAAEEKTVEVAIETKEETVEETIEVDVQPEESVSVETKTENEVPVEEKETKSEESTKE